MVEFAIVAPIFFLLLFGIIEGGRFIFYYETLSNAAREGARYAIVHGANSTCPSGPMSNPPPCYDLPGDNVVDRVEESAFGVLGSSLVVDPDWPNLNNGLESPVIVKVTFTYNTIVPFIPFPAITIEAESTLVINN
jgi:hypothetical protein